MEDKSIKEIGPDLSNQYGAKYRNGIKAANGSIYCMPRWAKYLLKIIPGEGQNAEVQILRDMQLPEGGYDVGALANDGCIYYFPDDRYDNDRYDGGRILKLDPNNGYETHKSSKKLSILYHHGFSTSNQINQV